MMAGAQVDIMGHENESHTTGRVGRLAGEDFEVNALLK